MNERAKIQFVAAHFVDKATAPRTKKVYFVVSPQIGGVVGMSIEGLADLDVFDSHKAAEAWMEITSRMFDGMKMEVESMTLGDYIEKYEDDKKEKE